MKINLSDMMDRWTGPLPPLEDLPVEDMDALRARTLEKVRAQGNGRKRRRVPRAVVLAAVLAVCVVGASAAAGLVFHNERIVGSVDEARADAAETGDGSYVVSAPNRTPPPALDYMIAQRRAPSDHWTDPEKLGGVAGFTWVNWREMTVTEAEGPVKARTVTGRTDTVLPAWAVKYEYTARRPSLLAETGPRHLTLDHAWLEGTYTAPDYTCLYLDQRDSTGRETGESLLALYATPAGRWVQVEYSYDARTPDLGSSYIVEGHYDRAETYTSATGLEAVIKTASGSLWADVQTDHGYLSLYGAWITVEEAEAILDHLALSEGP